MAPVIGGFLNDKISPHAVWYGGLIIGLSSTLGLFLLGRSRALSAAGNLAAPQTT
jgi:hypothetical protein